MPSLLRWFAGLPLAALLLVSAAPAAPRTVGMLVGQVQSVSAGSITVKQTGVVPSGGGSRGRHYGRGHHPGHHRGGSRMRRVTRTVTLNLDPSAAVKLTGGKALSAGAMADVKKGATVRLLYGMVKSGKASQPVVTRIDVYDPSKK